MQITKIQQQDSGTTFVAKVKIIGGDLDKKAISTLSEKAKNIVRFQGIYRDSIPPEKEGVLL